MYYIPYQQNQYNQNHMDMGQENPDCDTLLIEDITKAIIEEVHGYYKYEKLIELSANAMEKQVISDIAQDEAKHYHWLSSILDQLGAPEPQYTEGELPSDFVEGIRSSIEDELQASKTYAELEMQATDPNIAMYLRHASQDEQRHATWLLYLLSYYSE